MNYKKNRIAFALFFLCTGSVFAQEGFVSAGGDAAGSNGSVSFSIGQIFYKNDVGTNGSFNEGIQQPSFSNLITYYLDADADGFGNPNNTIVASGLPQGYVTFGTDCDDANPAINPGAVDVWRIQVSNATSLVI
ncbi:hypothetical protein [Flavobacterium sp.]|uniref:hypothetical protein n=1 Tax=Flavobacterium sp. TaxID=239 RepID=UPI00375042BF